LHDAPEPPDPPSEPVTALVEYLVVAFPDRAALDAVVPALANLVRSERIRVLDIVVLVRDPDGGVEVVEAAEVGSLAPVVALEGSVGLMSENDLHLASQAVRPGEAGLVLVAEDRWAEELSAAVDRAGGQIVAGERVPWRRVEAVLTDPPDDDPGG
jgi:hypothetical protein